MASKAKKNTTTRKKKTIDFASLKTTDLKRLFGDTIYSRGHTYQANGQVEELRRTNEGGLVAWVEGTATYATTVTISKKKVVSNCTCPYGLGCKHAVAVILEFQAQTKAKKTIPLVSATDQRLEEIKKDFWSEEWAEEFDDDDGFFEDDDGDGEDNDEDEERKDSADIDNRNDRRTSKKPSIVAMVKSRKVSQRRELRDALLEKSKEELVALLESAIAADPKFEEELRHQCVVSGKDERKIRTVILSEIERLRCGPQWDDDRYGDHSGMDVSRLNEGLTALLKQGHADAVVSMGDELLATLTNVVEHSHNDSVCDDAAEVMTIVVRALQDSSLSTVDKMEKAAFFNLHDRFNLYSDGLKPFWKKKFSKGDWSVFADRLFAHLNDRKKDTGTRGFSVKYRSDLLTDMAVNALSKSGRSDEIAPLCIRMAEATENYERIAEVLIGRGDAAGAQEWLRKGIVATAKHQSVVAQKLRCELIETCRSTRDWATAAALCADQFFEEPSLRTYTDLSMVCVKAGVWDRVKPVVIRFLETGHRPEPASGGAAAKQAKAWPLAPSGLPLLREKRGPAEPSFDVLAQIAMAEKNIVEVVKYFDCFCERIKTSRTQYGYQSNQLEEEVATAIAATHPDRAVKIWKDFIESFFTQGSQKIYEKAIVYLKRIKSILEKAGRGGEWKSYVEELKAANSRKRSVVAVLVKLEKNSRQ
ncbi:MAG: SWIM zinc finger domain-containing protein [Chitinivibrionales bacterium]|nr:SWIM zinc finger domain-containing protein [Chitinivibrionales bacterium]